MAAITFYGPLHSQQSDTKLPNIYIAKRPLQSNVKDFIRTCTYILFVYILLTKHEIKIT